MNEPITEFKDEYRFLSNFFHAPIKIGRHNVYPTNEHAFQALKCVNPDDHGQVMSAKTAAEAKKLGKQVIIKPNWNEIRNDVMFFINMVKYTTHQDLKQRLLATGSRELIEGNWWKDIYWGVCEDVGENHLGKILMRIRYIMGG